MDEGGRPRIVSPLTPALSPLRGEGGRARRFSPRNVLCLLLIPSFVIFVSPASALILVGRGNAPVRDAGWPEGTLAVANLESRVGWWEGPPFGGGLWSFNYRGDTAAFIQALTNFAAIRAPALDLVIRDGPQENTFLKDEKDPKTDTRVDWTFTVWVPASWHRLYNNPKIVFDAINPNSRKPVDPPRLDAYIGGGQVDWAKVTVPPNIRLRDERASTAGVDLSGGSVVRAEFYDMDSGKPVSGAHLIIENVSWQAGPNAHWDKERFAEAVSDVAGRVQIEKIPPNTIRVSVTADGYAPRQLDQHTHVRPEFLKFAVELAKVASIRGIVTDAEGTAIKGVKVRTQTEIASNGFGYNDGRHYEPPDTWSVETDDAGRFELTGLPAGYAQLYATARGYHFSDLHTIHEVPATNVVLRLRRASGILVKIIDKDGRPLSRLDGNPLIVEVVPKEGSKVGSWGGSATVKDDGTYEFENVSPGEYRISSHPNPSSGRRKYAPEQIVTVKPGEPVSVKIVYE